MCICLRGLRLQIPREEPGDRVERDRIEIVIQVGVIGPRDDQQFLVRRIHAMLELLIRGLAEVQRMRFSPWMSSAGFSISPM